VKPPSYTPDGAPDLGREWVDVEVPVPLANAGEVRDLNEVTTLSVEGVTVETQVTVPIIVMDRRGGMYVRATNEITMTKLEFVEGLEAFYEMKTVPVQDSLVDPDDDPENVAPVGLADPQQVPVVTIPEERLIEFALYCAETVSFFTDNQPHSKPDSLPFNPADFGYFPVSYPPPQDIHRADDDPDDDDLQMLSAALAGPTHQFTRPIGVELPAEGAEAIFPIPTLCQITERDGAPYPLACMVYLLNDVSTRHLVMKSTLLQRTGYDALDGVVEYDKNWSVIPLRRVTRSQIPASCKAARGAFAVGASILATYNLRVPGYNEHIVGYGEVPRVRSTALADFSNLVFQCTLDAPWVTYDVCSRTTTYTRKRPEKPSPFDEDDAEELQDEEPFDDEPHGWPVAAYPDEN
jgi:hypothetical protein